MTHLCTNIIETILPKNIVDILIQHIRHMRKHHVSVIVHIHPLSNCLLITLES